MPSIFLFYLETYIVTLLEKVIPPAFLKVSLPKILYNRQPLHRKREAQTMNYKTICVEKVTFRILKLLIALKVKLTISQISPKL